MKKLIINADDFGASKSINEGIIKGFQKGIITSTTAMANMPHFIDSMKLAKKNPTLGIGVHLNLIDGKGFVLGELSRKVAVKSMLGVIPYKKLVEEFQEQFSRVDKHVEVTHVDTHQHQGVFPNIRRAMIEVAKEYKVKKVRLPTEYYLDLTNPSSLWKQALINMNGAITRIKLNQADFVYPKQFFGVSSTGRFNLEYLRKFSLRIKGIAELCVHPGLIEEYVLQGDFLEKSRPIELNALISKEAKEILKNNKVSLISYRDL
jgi:chitin disaccharide deacetylase